VRAATLGNGREPDVVVVLPAKAHLVRETFVDGPPDLVVEVVSDDSVERDYETKRAEYAAAGIPEYWIVDPRSDLVDALFDLDVERLQCAAAHRAIWLEGVARLEIPHRCFQRLVEQVRLAAGL
jgi:hypothetical protein